MSVTWKSGEQSGSEVVDKVLVAVGRRPVTDNLGLREIGVVIDSKGFVKVNEKFETNINGVFAIGDVIGGLMLAMRPGVVVEIGEANARAGEVLRKYLPSGGKFSRDENEVSAADLVLVSGVGDGKFEESVFHRLGHMKFQKPPIVMFNDTRKWEMLRFCREISYPKLDMTSFGRWTGTMLVELTIL